MKIGGIDPTTLPTEEFLVLPRGEETIVFRAIGVPNYDEFDAMCPEPTAPMINRAGQGWVPNLKEPGYTDMMKTYSARKMSWLVIKSLEPSDIEWDQVSLDDPSTWTEWDQDFIKNGFTMVECNRIQHLAFEANCLDEAKLEKAREAFLRGQEPIPKEYSGQSTEPETTPPGKPASE